MIKSIGFDTATARPARILNIVMFVSWIIAIAYGIAAQTLGKGRVYIGNMCGYVNWNAECADDLLKKHGAQWAEKVCGSAVQWVNECRDALITLFFDRAAFEAALYGITLAFTALAVASSVGALRRTRTVLTPKQLEGLTCSEHILLLHNYIAYNGVFFGVVIPNDKFRESGGAHCVVAADGIAAMFRYLGCVLSYLFFIVVLFGLVYYPYLSMLGGPLDGSWSYGGRSHYTRDGPLLILLVPYLASLVVTPVVAWFLREESQYAG